MELPTTLMEVLITMPEGFESTLSRARTKFQRMHHSSIIRKISLDLYMEEEVWDPIEDNNTMNMETQETKEMEEVKVSQV